MSTATRATRKPLTFKNPPKDLGLNRQAKNGNILMFFAGNKPTDKANVSIVLDSKTNVIWLNSQNKASKARFNAPVARLLRKKGTSLYRLAQMVAATGVAFPKAS